jgi:hypothetical protein
MFANACDPAVSLASPVDAVAGIVFIAGSKGLATNCAGMRAIGMRRTIGKIFIERVGGLGSDHRILLLIVTVATALCCMDRQPPAA